MDTNFAAFLTGHMKKPLVVEEAEDRFADENEIVIKNAAVAMNRIDIAFQEFPWSIFNYPLILGVDVAGEVVEVGSQASQFSVGDRVIGHALRLATEDDRHGGFQKYTVLMSNMACVIPPSLPYENAVVLPLSISTAAAALFQKDTMALQPPTVYPEEKDIWIIVLGGTGSVGSNGVRLAVAAGYKVITTASTRSFSLARQLGATEVVDYKHPDVANELARILSGKEIGGAFDGNGQPDTIKTAIEAVSKCNGNRFVTTVGDWIDPSWVSRDVKAKAIMGISIRDNEVGQMVYEGFLQNALAAERYMKYPEPLVFGEGLGSIQDALEKSKDSKGKKVVVTIK
ncbi:oxidoreductase [Daldinia caldariorum]|uniref:oxidoreductase n=1 Tax=Daldinia caldariorum TaxID=326644 RepID=UPI00200827FE|nr:oxidoreductase [Daldinia caldariorum]KAI1463654.1 oxidoreductase [Daldinia caldariorum]